MILDNYFTIKKFVNSSDYNNVMNVTWLQNQGYGMTKNAWLNFGNGKSSGSRLYLYGIGTCAPNLGLVSVVGANHTNYLGGAVQKFIYNTSNHGYSMGSNEFVGFGQNTLAILPSIIGKEWYGPATGATGAISCYFYNDYTNSLNYVNNICNVGRSYDPQGEYFQNNCDHIDWRVVIGIGTTNVARNDYKLAVPFNGGTQITTYGLDPTDSYSAKFSLTFTNTESTSVTISEIGLSFGLTTTHTGGPIDNYQDLAANTQFMIYRAVLSNAVTVDAAETATFSITFDDDISD